MSVTAPTPSWHDLDERVEVLAPEGAPGFAEFLDATFRTASPGSPFAEERLRILGAVSRAFLAHPLLRQDPASVAAAYWMRPAQLARLARSFEHRSAQDPSIVRVPVGRVFHVAPANVDTLFLYSWALSFACGNANVVRVSSERGRVVDSMLEVLRTVGQEESAWGASDRFITYRHEERTTSALSAWCSHRVIWGGDETVAALRVLPLESHASERVFGSKFSYSVFRAGAWEAADAATRERATGAFFNDLFWFDQMACSSPHVLFWVGDAASFDRATESFERDLQREVDRRGFVPAPSSAVSRRDFAFRLAADLPVRVDLRHPGFVGVRGEEPAALTREACGGGLIRHVRLDRIEDLILFAGERDQTVTHFGFEPEDLATLARGLGARGVDRVVPVGEALAFDALWDGFDLLDDFTRGVRLRLS